MCISKLRFPYTRQRMSAIVAMRRVFLPPLTGEGKDRGEDFVGACDASPPPLSSSVEGEELGTLAAKIRQSGKLRTVTIQFTIGRN